MRHLTKWLFAAGCSLALLGFTTITDAQTAEPHALNGVMVRWQVFDKFEFWRWNADGTYTLAAELPDSLLPDVMEDIALSPDGQRVAFTSGYWADSGPQLYVVSLNSQHIKQYKAPGVASIRWSPNSDALLLQRPSVFISGESTVLADGDSYIFDLAAETFTLIAETNDKQVTWDAKWTPTGDAVIYSQTMHEPQQKSDIPDLYRVTRDGSSRQKVTHLNVQAPQIIDFTQPAKRHFCSISDFKWSSVNARWYYILACFAPNEDIIVSSLFSVDMSGDNRLEVDLYEQFPEMYKPNGLSGYEVTDFFPTADGVYLVIEPPDHKVLILNVTQPGQADVIVVIPDSSSREAIISKNNSNIAIDRYEQKMAIVDMVNRQIQIRTLSETGLSLWNAQWLDGETLLMNQSSHDEEHILAWNVRTGRENIITTQFEDGLNVMLLQPQEVP